MNKERLYVCALVAQHVNGIAYTSAACMATSIHEAVGKGIAASKLTFPSPKYYNQNAVASLIPDEYVIQGFNALLQGESSDA